MGYGAHTFPRDISPKRNVIVRPGFELVNYDVAVQHVSNYAMETQPMFILWVLIGLVGKVRADGPRNRGSIPGRVIPKTQKMVLDTCLTLNIIRYVSRIEWSNPGKGVAPSLTLRCSSCWKGSLRVALDYGHQVKIYVNEFTMSFFLFIWC